jgi:plasmid replication initiation protein
MTTTQTELTVAQQLREQLAALRDKPLAEIATVGELSRALKDFDKLVDKANYAVKLESDESQRMQRNGQVTDRAKEAVELQEKVNAIAERKRLEREAEAKAKGQNGDYTMAWYRYAERVDVNGRKYIERTPVEPPV